MTHELIALLVQYGLLVVFLSACVEQLGIPIPAVPVLVVAGALAADGRLPVIGVVLVALAGSLLPDLGWYWAGRRFGTRVMAMLCRISLSPDSCVHRSQLHFERWRGRSLLVAKFVPGLSVIAPPLVGALGLPFRAFVLLDGLGALLWIGVSVALGYAFADQVDRVLDAVAQAGAVALAVVAALLALYIAMRWWHRRRVRAALAIPRITPEALNDAMRDGRNPLVIDVRSSTSLLLTPRMIDGARRVDPAHARAALRDVPVEREIVSYCDCPNEATAAKVASGLLKHGYLHVHPLAGGIRAWEAAGYPVRPVPPHTSLTDAQPGASLRN